MKRRTHNTRLSNKSQRRMQYFVDVNKRGGRERWDRVLKICSISFKMFAFLAICGGGYFAATVGWKKLFWDNPDYHLKEVRYSTDGSLNREQALTTARLQLGHNIFSYSLDGAREALRKLPQVDQVILRRTLPNRIEVQVTERKPVAWLTRKLDDPLSASDNSLLLDARGIVFKPKRILPEQEVLPVIYGVEIGDLVVGAPVRSAEMEAALDLLRRSVDSASLRIISIDISKGYCIVATDQSRRQLTFGLDDIQGQLERFNLVLNETVKMGQEIQAINLMPERNIPVAFARALPPGETLSVPEETPGMESPRAPGPGTDQEPTIPKAIPIKREKPSSPKKPGPNEGLKKPFRRHV